MSSERGKRRGENEVSLYISGEHASREIHYFPMGQNSRLRVLGSTIEEEIHDDKRTSIRCMRRDERLYGWTFNQMDRIPAFVHYYL